MGTVEIRLYVLVVNFQIKAITMATSHLMTGTYFPQYFKGERKPGSRILYGSLKLLK